MHVSIDHSVRNNGRDADRQTFPQTICLTKPGIAYVPTMAGIYVLLWGQNSLSRYLHVLHLLLVGGGGENYV